MIIAHLSDLHLGFRAYNRSSDSGMNVREEDVMTAFARALEAIVHLQPQLVVVAGDLFYSVRPSNAAIAEAFRRFSGLSARLPDVPVVIIAGDRDTPRSPDTAPILPLFREIPRVVVVTERIERIELEAIGATLVAAPHGALARGGPGSIEPPPGSGAAIIALHGRLTGPLANRKLQAFPEAGGATVPETAIDPVEWAYVALGHHPVATELAPNVWYPGSIERTSSNIWAEAGAAKGFLSYDTAIRAATFHPLESRTVIDLPPLSARDLSAAELDDAVAAAVDGVPGGLDGKIVRLVLTEMPRQRLRELNHRRLRDFRAAALHFVLEAIPAAPGAPELPAIAARGQSLEKQVENYLVRHWTPTMEGIDRSRLVELAQDYLGRAGEGGDG